MASISKRISGAWQNTSYGIRATATDTITTLPTTIYGDGTNATVSIKGNTVQSSTPTPSNPVPVVGVGELDSGQYKIPISSAGQTTSIYLGETQTTRKIKKQVLTGQENWENNINPTLFGVQGLLNLSPFIPKVLAYCTQYVYNPIQSGLSTGMVNGEFALQKSTTIYNLFIRNTDYTSLSDFKDYLRQQYAAGTPVCVWYVLETAETGIVNEQLMKIGDYTDEVNGISIPTTDGASTLSVDTTVQPSEVSVNYHGWHMGTVHERTSGEWD